MNQFSWAVIGAGPAGIAAVGKLIDLGVPGHEIAWIDPSFSVGDLGSKWTFVPSNTRVALFLRFYQNCKSFRFAQRPLPFAIEELPSQETCELKNAVEPLQWITDQLRKQVNCFQDWVTDLRPGWEIIAKRQKITADKVILAIGCEPKKLTYTQPEIPLETAFHPALLAQNVQPNDIIGVFGSSHSAVLAMANLLLLPVKKVIQFYRRPHRYAIYHEDWIEFDDTGLKGFSAQWAKDHLDQNPPERLERLLVTDPRFEQALAECTKLVYTVGFERRKIPAVEQYDDKTGKITSGLYGVGIAFPEAKTNRLGEVEHRVGLWKFMDYLNNVMPKWLADPKN